MDPAKYLKNEEMEAEAAEPTELDAISPIDKLAEAMGISDDMRDTFEAAFVEAVQSIVDGDIPTEEG